MVASGQSRGFWGGDGLKDTEKPHPSFRMGFGKKYDRIRLCRVWAGATNPALKTWVQVLVDGARNLFVVSKLHEAHGF